MDANLSSSSSDLDRHRKEVKEMIASVSQMAATFEQPDKFDPIAALRLERDMRTGRGKRENWKRLTQWLPTYSVRPTLHSDADGLTEAMVKRFIGSPLYTEVTKATPKVALSPLFRCCSVSGACINAICPMTNGTVWVAHDVVKGSSDEQRVALYTSEGKALREQKVGGRVSIARAYGDWVYVSGPNVHRVMEGQETREADLVRFDYKKSHQKPSTPKHAFAALSKRDIRFSVKAPGANKARDSVICALEARTLPSLWIVSQAAFSIAAHLPQALDVDSTGQYFAVVVPRPAVQLHHPSQPNPVAVYNPPMENFSPADVCFHVMDGTEVLLVADWFNSAVHVLGFKDGFRFRGYLGAGCPLMMQPTALTSDYDNRLWIGCKGGQLLVCVSADDSSDEDEDEDKDEDEDEDSAEEDDDREEGVVSAKTWSRERRASWR